MAGATRPCLYCEYVRVLCINFRFLIFPARRERDAAVANGEEYLGKKFIYGQNTSNGILRGHLDRHHQADYLQLAGERGWKVQLPSQVNLEKVIVKTVDVTPRVPFSVDTAIDYIIKFVVANDQVSVNQLSCTSSLTLCFSR